MAQPNKKFNLICAILSAFFLLGTMWIYVRTTKNYEIMNYEIKIEQNQNLEIRNLKLEIRDNVTTTLAGPEIEIVKTLPGRINLNVPFTSQAPEKNWGQPWQDACEEAALLMLDAYYKKYNLSPLFARDEMAKMVEWEEKQGWGRSIEMEKVARIWDEYFARPLKHENIKTPARNASTSVAGGLKHASVIENPTIEQIKAFVASGNPVLVVADGKVLPNPNFRNGGPVYHALIIRGYDEDEFITNDPGTQFGKNFKYKYNDLMNSIHEWNNGDVKNGRKVILVIE